LETAIAAQNTTTISGLQDGGQDRK